MLRALLYDRSVGQVTWLSDRNEGTFSTSSHTTTQPRQRFHLLDGRMSSMGALDDRKRSYFEHVRTDLLPILVFHETGRRLTAQ